MSGEDQDLGLRGATMANSWPASLISNAPSRSVLYPGGSSLAMLMTLQAAQLPSLSVLVLLAILCATLFSLSMRYGHWAVGLASRRLRVSSDIIALRVYPIKSCRGFEVDSAKLLRTGLDMDRNWMFINSDTREFLTIRTNPRMTLITTDYDRESDELIISTRDHKSKTRIPAHPTSEWLQRRTNLVRVGIWGEQTNAWEYSSRVSDPFSEFLGSDVRLVYRGPTPRILRGCGSPQHLGRPEATKFADMMPILIASEASLKELNGRLASVQEDEINIERFRPNVVIRGSKPWSEDDWQTVSIIDTAKGLDMDVVSRCLRCQVPNVDPDTGEKHQRQPWNQLVRYRRIDGGNKYKPSFGMLCVPRNEGIISVGMKLRVTGTTDKHFFINPMKS